MTSSRPDPARPSNGDGVDRRPLGSRLLHFVDRVAGRSILALTVITLDLLWVVFSVFVSFAPRIETVFQTTVAALTLALVFVIQHTQTRQQVATQRKLDEILRSLPHADNALIALEDANDHTLASTHSDHRSLRREALT